MKTLITSLLGLLLPLSISLGVQAQEAPPPPPAAGAEAAPVNFSESDLQNFVAVQPALEEIRIEYTEKLQNATDADVAAELQLEASELMVDAVQQQGIDVDTYNQISLAMQSDPSLRARIEEMMN